MTNQPSDRWRKGNKMEVTIQPLHDKMGQADQLIFVQCYLHSTCMHHLGTCVAELECRAEIHENVRLHSSQCSCRRRLQPLKPLKRWLQLHDVPLPCCGLSGIVVAAATRVSIRWRVGLKARDSETRSSRLPPHQRHAHQHGRGWLIDAIAVRNLAAVVASGVVA